MHSPRSREGSRRSARVGVDGDSPGRNFREIPPKLVLLGWRNEENENDSCSE